MPAGDDQLLPLTWQPVPGADGAQIYPLIRKIDTISSNSYLIATGDVLILIDPGGLPEQAEALSDLIGRCREEKDRPVFTFLTHAHVDHFAGVLNVPVFAHDKVIVFAVQETGAVALERADGGITQADLLNISLVPLIVALPVLTRDRQASRNVPVQLAFANGAEVTITRDRTGTGDSVLERETIRFGPGPSLEVLHTPGHSPDSICIRIGSLLFCGDIVFAANPGIAGQVGWSQENLISSLRGIEALLSLGGILAVCPGHGRIIAAPDAVRMIIGVRRDAARLEDIARLTPAHVAEIAAFADDSMEQVNELFTIMAGRLYYVSYVLDELGESELAETTAELLRSDAVDELLLAFRDFSEEHHRGDPVSIHLALKAGQVIGRLQRLFDQDELARIIDPNLARRASRLLSDYTTTLRGFTPPREVTVCEIRSLVEVLITGLSVPACSDAELLDSGDDADTFSRLLIARVGARPVLEDIEIAFTADSPVMNGLLDRDRFTDLLTYIFEDLVGTMTDRILVHLRRQDDGIILTLSCRPSGENSTYERRTARFLQGLAGRAGGRLVMDRADGTETFAITVSAVL